MASKASSKKVDWSKLPDPSSDQESPSQTEKEQESVSNPSSQILEAIKTIRDPEIQMWLTNVPYELTENQLVEILRKKGISIINCYVPKAKGKFKFRLNHQNARKLASLPNLTLQKRNVKISVDFQQLERVSNRKRANSKNSRKYREVSIQNLVKGNDNAQLYEYAPKDQAPIQQVKIQEPEVQQNHMAETVITPTYIEVAGSPTGSAETGAEAQIPQIEPEVNVGMKPEEVQKTESKVESPRVNVESSCKTEVLNVDSSSLGRRIKVSEIVVNFEDLKIAELHIRIILDLKSLQVCG